MDYHIVIAQRVGCERPTPHQLLATCRFRSDAGSMCDWRNALRSIAAGAVSVPTVMQAEIDIAFSVAWVSKNAHFQCEFLFMHLFCICVYDSSECT